MTFAFHNFSSSFFVIIVAYFTSVLSLADRVRLSILTPYLSDKPWYPEIRFRNYWIFQQVHWAISSGWIVVAPFFFILALLHFENTLTDHLVFFSVFRVTYAEQIWAISSSLVVVENLSLELASAFLQFHLEDYSYFHVILINFS